MKTLLLLLCCALVLFLIGCSKENVHIGKWRTEQSASGVTVAAETEIKADGTYVTTTSLDGTTSVETGTWTATDTTYTYNVMSREIKGPQAKVWEQGLAGSPKSFTSPYRTDGKDKIIHTVDGREIISTRIK